jgi:isocitrate dehydrogenase
MLGSTLNAGVITWLEEKKTPSRKVNEPDNRAANYYLALYWAEALAKTDTEFVGIAKELRDNEATIVGELNGCQGNAVDIGGYFHMDLTKLRAAMQPSATFNKILALQS